MSRESPHWNYQGLGTGVTASGRIAREVRLRQLEEGQDPEGQGGVERSVTAPSGGRLVARFSSICPRCQRELAAGSVYRKRRIGHSLRATHVSCQELRPT